MMLLLLCVLAVLGRGIQGQELCGDVFQYVEDGQGGWMGMISLSDPGGNVFINVTLYVTSRISNEQQIGSGLSLSNSNPSPGVIVYNLRFPIQDPLPVIGQIVFNGRVICQQGVPQYTGALTRLFYTFTLTRSNSFVPQPRIPEPLATRRPTSNFVLPNRSPGTPVNRRPRPTVASPSRKPETPVTSRPQLTVRPTQAMKLTQSNEDRCGVRTVPRPLVFNGRDTLRGEWPWVVALYRWISMKIICASTLISMKHVITAAHCIDGRDMEDLIVGVGKYDTEKEEEKGVQYRQIMRIVSHEDYNEPQGTLKSDIAILFLNRKVKYDDFARPICLWDRNTDSTSMAEQVGVVVGWGEKDQTRTGSTKPLEVTVPIVSNEECRSSNPVFNDERNLVNDFTFCGGFRNGSGPCRGDSGGGLVLSRRLDDGTHQWYLRGIVSVSFPGNRNKCNLDLFTLYTDVSMFMDWITNAMRPAVTSRRLFG